MQYGLPPIKHSAGRRLSNAGEGSLPPGTRRVLPWMLAVLFAAPGWSLAQENAAPPTSAAATPGGVANRLAVQSNTFADRMVRPDEVLGLVLSQDLAPLAGQFAVFLGVTDITSTLAIAGERVLYGPVPGGLPAGKQEVVFMQFVQDQWMEIARLPLVVEGAAEPVPGTAAVPAAARPALRADITGQGNRTQSRNADGSTRASAHTGGLQGSLSAEWKQGELGATLQANFAGSSQRTQALRFAERASEANKLDLASYVLELRAGETRFTLGQMNNGNHPWLMSGLSFRGASVRMPLGQRTDLLVSAQNGSGIVGLQRLTGLYDSEHNFTGATLGVEAWPEQRGRLRVEFSALDAQISSAQGSFNQSPRQATQESHGFGLRLTGRTLDGRGRFDIAHASSTFRAPQSDVLLVTTPSNTARAWSAEGAWQLLSPSTDPTAMPPATPMTATATLKHEQADPLYRSLGAGTGADYAQTALMLQAGIGVWAMQLNTSVRADNVDRVQERLVNRLRNAQFTVSAPLGQVFAPAAPAAWPSASLSLGDVRQWATDAPIALDPTLVPDLQTRTWTLALNWADARWNLGLNAGGNRQINRQPAAAGAGTHTRTFGVQAGWRPIDQLNLTAGLSPNISRQLDTGLKRTQLNPNLGLVWQLPQDYVLTINANFDRSFDSQSIQGARNWGLNNQLSKTFKVSSPFGSQQWPMQVTLRHFINHAHSQTRFGVIDTSTTLRNEGVALTFALSLF